MSDVIAFVVPTFDPEGATRVYPSVNHLGADGARTGRKTDEYHWLRRRVREAAAAEMVRTGWWTADYYVDVTWTRIVVARRGFDPMNALKVELDAMEPFEPSDAQRRAGDASFPGVYLNDNLVIPHPNPPMYDPTPGAVDRVRIVVERRWYPLIEPPPYAKPKSARREPRDRRIIRSSAAGVTIETKPPASRFEQHFPVAAAIARAGDDATERWKATGEIPDGYALLGDRLIPHADALRMISPEHDDAPRPRRRTR